MVDSKHKEFSGSITRSKCKVNFVKDSYSLRGKLGTSSNLNVEITKFRQSHTSLVFIKEKRGKSNNKCGNKIGKGQKLVLMCSTPRAW